MSRCLSCCPRTCRQCGRSISIGYTKTQVTICSTRKRFFNHTQLSFRSTGTRAIVGSGRWSQRLVTPVGHIRWSWQGSSLCLRQVGSFLSLGYAVDSYLLPFSQVWCGAVVFLHSKSDLATQLQDDVVSRDTSLLSRCTRCARRLQERPAIHVPRWELFVLLWGEGDVCKVRCYHIMIDA